jgi:spermidine dehydrogenase
VAKALLMELGIDVKKFCKAFDRDLYDSLSLRQGVFFDRETFGVDRLVVEDKTGEGDRDEKARRRAFAARAPFTEKARHDFLRLHEEPVDYLPDLSADEKRARLKRISYANFLRLAFRTYPGPFNETKGAGKHRQTRYPGVA